MCRIEQSLPARLSKQEKKTTHRVLTYWAADLSIIRMYSWWGFTAFTVIPFRTGSPQEVSFYYLTHNASHLLFLNITARIKFGHMLSTTPPFSKMLHFVWTVLKCKDCCLLIVTLTTREQGKSVAWPRGRHTRLVYTTVDVRLCFVKVMMIQAYEMWAWIGVKMY